MDTYVHVRFQLNFDLPFSFVEATITSSTGLENMLKYSVVQGKLSNVPLHLSFR